VRLACNLAISRAWEYRHSHGWATKECPNLRRCWSLSCGFYLDGAESLCPLASCLHASLALKIWWRIYQSETCWPAGSLSPSLWFAVGTNSNRFGSQIGGLNLQERSSHYSKVRAFRSTHCQFSGTQRAALGDPWEHERCWEGSFEPSLSSCRGFGTSLPPTGLPSRKILGRALPKQLSDS
jgi:hypothetical protein